ncbi:MAG: glycerate kinase [Faecalibacterium sp.]
MKVVISIDSMKGSLSTIQAGNAARMGVLRAVPDAQVIVMPLADGGEGTTDALLYALGGNLVAVDVVGPYGKPTKAQYGQLSDGKTAVMEMAQASGITLDPTREPLVATSYGVGQMILHAIHAGYREFVIGIGGSATNDGGVGMLQALGYSFCDQDGAEIPVGGEAVGKIAAISAEKVQPVLKECVFRIACDVNNPLCGAQGATAIYGPQKGVTEQTYPILENALSHFAAKTADFLGKDESNYPGVGAAGGLGFAFKTYLNATLRSGVGLILEAMKLEAQMDAVDYVITGEGRLDQQTSMGKAPVGVAQLAKKHGATVVAIAGCVTDDAGGCNDAGIDAFFPILRRPCTLEEAVAISQATQNVTDTVEQIFRLIKSLSH